MKKNQFIVGMVLLVVAAIASIALFPTMLMGIAFASTIVGIALVAARLRKSDVIHTQNRESRSSSDFLAIAGTIIGLVGFLFAGLPLGIVAILCGIASMATGSSKGILSLIVGVIDVVVVFLIINS